MKKLCFLTALFICLNLTFISNANAETRNWCGKYFEQNEQGFLRIPMADVRQGSHSCTPEDFASRSQISGTVNIALNFTKSISTLANWSKFNNHIIEISGKLKHGEISRTRLIRDTGI